ncbi:hypothetical protein [Dictyobacter formicarum]|uniref:Uncharacterized protein n=1 Tax=Dictyobacter formicarum TaxID=2778368 RepID=A0ABQ3VW85_9CHLR|nr:hypothetical protein [Dictyobacter formicarum]GHO89561.1 hypothetical protein KSZ_75670 [Dictyobacter formicarum]
MENITVNTVTFHWMYDELVVQADEKQHILSASDTYQLLNYLYNKRDNIYGAHTGVTVITPLDEQQVYLYEVESEYGYE